MRVHFKVRRISKNKFAFPTYYSYDCHFLYFKVVCKCGLICMGWMKHVVIALPYLFPIQATILMQERTVLIFPPFHNLQHRGFYTVTDQCYCEFMMLLVADQRSTLSFFSMSKKLHINECFFILCIFMIRLNYI